MSDTVMLRGQDLLNNPYLNKGTAFSTAERDSYGLHAFLPAVHETQDAQEERVYQGFCALNSRREQRLYLMRLRDENERLFFYSMSKHLIEYMPVVYAPTVADAITHYADQRSRSRVAYIDVEHPERIADVLREAAGKRNIRLVVCTDGEGILGIGDWGIHGAEILTGKTAVYTAAAGLNPEEILSVVLDAGCNREELLRDPRYLGLRCSRVRGAEYNQMIDALVKACAELWPSALLHWEDFGRENAARILEQYREKILTLNDDIQGTGVTVLGAYEAARRIARTEYKDMRFIVFGAGTAGIGIADQIVDGMVAFGKMSPEAARKNIFLVDRQGLVLSNQEDLTDGQRRYAHSTSDILDLAHKAGKVELPDLLSLEAIMSVVKPAGIVGTSTCAHAFTEAAICEMAQHVDRPFIAPISNPTELLECTAAEALSWTDGRALVITGTPSAPVQLHGVSYEIGQGNNALMYPGICLGALASDARTISREMLLEAARALADLVKLDREGAAILPPVSGLVHTTRVVAEAVGRCAVRQGLSRQDGMREDDVPLHCDELSWSPRY